jgi:hypothetical protein
MYVRRHALIGLPRHVAGTITGTEVTIGGSVGVDGKSGTVLGVISRPTITAVEMPTTAKKATQIRSNLCSSGADANALLLRIYSASVKSSEVKIRFILSGARLDSKVSNGRCFSSRSRAGTIWSVRRQRLPDARQ